jgi:hypothetical protein|nr:MAG TPA: hypothetical protein [Caudoviricetes sp.]
MKLNHRYSKVTNILLWAILFLVVCCMVTYAKGRYDERDVQTKIIESYKQKEKSAVYVTVDSSGAWLGSTPGAKESPLYNEKGQQVGKLKEVEE